jgi:hypothetical protein
VLVKEENLQQVLKCLDAAFHCLDDNKHGGGGDHGSSHKDEPRDPHALSMLEAIASASFSTPNMPGIATLPPIAPQYFLGRPVPTTVPKHQYTDTKATTPSPAKTAVPTPAKAVSSSSSTSTPAAAAATVATTGTSPASPIVPLGGKKGNHLPPSPGRSHWCGWMNNS